MPKRRAKSTANSSDEEAGPSQSQTQSKRANISEDEIQNLVNDLVYYLLVSDQKKIPVKRLDINKHVLKENAKAFASVLNLAKQKLNQVFDMNLKEIESRRGLYILVNNQKNSPENPHLNWSGDESAKHGLLLVILSYIFMMGGSVSEEALWKFLNKLGLASESIEPHEVFGDVKKLVKQEFKQQLYLEITKVPSTDPPTMEYQWGPRAKHELDKMEVLNFVCTMYGDKKPEDWVQQFWDAQAPADEVS